jgi:Asp-tRNA(Asn)/Glu-tRNA(Gln) amidotransferase B subunit
MQEQALDLTLEKAAADVIETFPDPAARYRSGHTGSLHVLVGHVRRKLHGKGDLETIREVLKRQIGVEE